MVEEIHVNHPGNTDPALHELQNLRRRVDGCGTAAEITDCGSQLQVRALIDELIANLSS